MTALERTLLSRGDDLRQRLEQTRRNIAHPPKNGPQLRESRQLEALYADLLAVIEAHELQLQLAKAMEPA